jgi:hypothetical protein
VLSLYFLTIFVIVSPCLTVYVVVILLLLLGAGGLGRGTGVGDGVEGRGAKEGISGTGSFFSDVPRAIITARGNICTAATIERVLILIKFNLLLGGVETIGSWNNRLSSKETSI